MRTWVIAHDFSETARFALSFAADQLAAMGGGNLCIVHVHHPSSGIDGGIDLGLFGAAADLENAYVAEAERLLAEALETERARHPSVTFSTQLVRGSPANVIVELAARLGAEQVVVGSHGRRGVERFFLGSVAERVTRKAHCSVMVVKRPPTA